MDVPYLTLIDIDLLIRNLTMCPICNWGGGGVLYHIQESRVRKSENDPWYTHYCHSFKCSNKHYENIETTEYFITQEHWELVIHLDQDQNMESAYMTWESKTDSKKSDLVFDYYDPIDKQVINQIIYQATMYSSKDLADKIRLKVNTYLWFR